MDFSISDEQRAFLDTVRKVCQKEIAPRAIKYLDGTWPAENMQRLAEIGVRAARALAGPLAGRLEIESTPGVGSRFELRLPRIHRSPRLTPADSAMYAK